MDQQILHSAQEIAEAFYADHRFWFWLIGACASIVAGAVPLVLIPMWTRSGRLLGLSVSIHRTAGESATELAKIEAILQATNELLVMHKNADNYGFGTKMTNQLISSQTEVMEAVSKNLATSNTTLGRLADMIDREQRRRERRDELEETLRKIQDAKDDN